MSLTRDQIRVAVAVDGIIDRLVEASDDPLDSHPLQVSGEEITWLEDCLSHLLLRWCQRRGVVIR